MLRDKSGNEVRVIMGSPYTGKTTALGLLANQGFTVFDTDWLLEDGFSLACLDRLKPHVKAASTPLRDMYRMVQSLAGAFVAKLIEADQELILFTKFYDDLFSQHLVKVGVLRRHVAYYYRDAKTTFQLSRERSSSISLTSLEHWYDGWLKAACSYYNSSRLGSDEFIMNRLAVTTPSAEGLIFAKSYAEDAKLKFFRPEL